MSQHRSSLRDRIAADRLADALQKGVDLLVEAQVIQGDLGSHPDPEPSLLRQCVDLIRSNVDAGTEPIRTIHQFACTGGTLVSRCVAAMPNVQLLSELDPLSTIQQAQGKPAFVPTDMVRLLRQATNTVSDETLIKLFQAELGVVYSTVHSQGMYLVVRDHTHSHFCTGAKLSSRPSLRELVQAVAPTLSLITVRNPVDSFLSLQSHGWIHFQPSTFEEYCSRYLAFLDRYETIPIVRYEDFTKDTKIQMQQICEHLALPYSESFDQLFQVFRLSGDSGRKPASGIKAPPAREGRDALLEKANSSACYRDLSERLGYCTEYM